MRFVIAALSVCVMMMLNLNSVSEHAAGKNPGENTRNEYEMTFLDRLGEMDFGQPRCRKRS